MWMLLCVCVLVCVCDTATTEIYARSLHDALTIWGAQECTESNMCVSLCLCVCERERGEDVILEMIFF